MFKIGKSHITPKGYLRANVVHPDGRRRLRLVHDVIWEESNGPIPQGYCIHHKDENKQNNSLSNLELIHRGEHTRMHKAFTHCKECGRALLRKRNAGRCGQCYNAYMRRYRHENGISGVSVKIRDESGRYCGSVPR